MSKSESVPKMLKDALPYPLPGITPIWGASHSNLFTLPRIVCLLFTLGMITDISRVHGGADRKLPDRPPAPATKAKPPYPKTSKSSHC